MDAELCLVAFEDAPMHPALLLVFWESLGNADSWAPRWTRGARICILTGPPGGFCPLSPNSPDGCCPIWQRKALRWPERSSRTHVRNREEPGIEAGLTDGITLFHSLTDFTKTEGRFLGLLHLPRGKVS